MCMEDEKNKINKQRDEFKQAYLSIRQVRVEGHKKLTKSSTYYWKLIQCQRKTGRFRQMFEAFLENLILYG